MNLEELRKEVDEVDSKIMKLLDQRVIACRTMGGTKRSSGLPIVDPKREKEILDRAYGLIGEEIFTVIIKSCRAVQGL